jgi:hypothetical protein
MECETAPNSRLINRLCVSAREQRENRQISLCQMGRYYERYKTKERVLVKESMQHSWVSFSFSLWKCFRSFGQFLGASTIRRTKHALQYRNPLMQIEEGL